jgi:hypothetical protein
VADADHTFTGEAARERVAALLDTLLETPRTAVAHLPARSDVEASARQGAAVEAGQDAGYD